MVTQSALQKQKLDKLEAAQALHDAAALAGVDLSTEKLEEVDKLVADAEALDIDIEAAKVREDQQATLKSQIDSMKTGTGRKTQADATATGSVEVGDPAWMKDPAKGYDSPKAFFGELMEYASGKVIQPSAQLQFLATAGSDEQNTIADPFGGFLVPESFSPGFLTTRPEVDPTVGRVTSIPMATPIVKLNARVDKNHATSVSGGLTVNRRTETQAITSSRMEMEQISLEATGLFGLTFVTQELMERSAISVAALLSQGFGDEFSSAILNEKINGTGVGEYLGVLNSGAKIEVAKEGGQSADTIVGENVVNMRARVWGYSNAIWIANHDTYPQLAALNISEGTTGITSFYQASLTEDRPDMLLGRPIFYSEYAQTLGDAGDIFVVDWSQYLEGTLSGMRSAESMHVRFLEHENTFKFWMENDGAPWWRTALTPKNGSTLSPIVSLAVRA